MSSDPIGRSIAHYRVTAKLGEGRMGEVYRATDTKLDREVALKVGYLDIVDHWLKRIDLEGGRPVRLARLGPGRGCGASWGARGTSDESADMQVYLTTWPSLDGKWRVSADKAAMPRWRRDGRELFFLAHDQQLMSASVALDGRAPKLGLPKPLFKVQRQVPYLARTTRWAVLPEGDRFLVLEPLGDGSALRRPRVLMTQLAGPGGRPR